MAKELIFLDAALKNKDEALNFVADAFSQTGAAADKASIYGCMADREKIMSTGIGRGIGIPHAECVHACKPAVAIVRPEKPLDFEALDGLPVDIILAVIVPPKKATLHLRLLAGISRLCKHTLFLEAARSAQTSGELLKQIRAIEETMAFH